MGFENLSTLNAVLNGISGTFLLIGFIQIKKGRRHAHKRHMVVALIASLLFLISYLIYHAKVGSVPYTHHDWTRPVYFAILIPHVILAAINVPFILLLLRYAWRETLDKHRRLARWVWPSWMFVSASGVIIYLMLYHL